MKITLACSLALVALAQAHRPPKHDTTTTPPPPTCPTNGKNRHDIHDIYPSTTCSGIIPGSVFTRFTGIFFGDFTLTGGQDILGPLAVRGTFTADSYTVNANHGTGSCSNPTADLSTYGLVVGGEVIASDIHIHGAAFLPEGTNTNTLEMLDTDCEAYTDQGTGLFDFHQVYQNAVFLQKLYAALAPTKKLNSDATLSHISLPNEDFDIITFNTCLDGCTVNADALSDPNTFLLGSGNWNGIPVTVGNSITLINNQPTAGIDPCRTIWNFYPVDSQGNYSPGPIEIIRQTGGQLGGFTLAPHADIIDGGTGNFAGLTIADNYMWEGSGVEMHDYNAIGGQCSGFVPCLPIYNNTPPIYPIIPDPNDPIPDSSERDITLPSDFPFPTPDPTTDFQTPSIPTITVPTPTSDFQTPSIPTISVSTSDFQTPSIPTITVPTPTSDFQTPSIPTITVPTPTSDFQTPSIPTISVSTSDFQTPSIPTISVSTSDFQTPSIPTISVSTSDFQTPSIPTITVPKPSCDFQTPSIPTISVPTPTSDHPTPSIPTMTLPTDSETCSETDVPIETPCEDEDHDHHHHHHHENHHHEHHHHEYPPTHNDDYHPHGHWHGGHHDYYHKKGSDDDGYQWDHDSGSKHHHHHCGHDEDEDSGHHEYHHEDYHHDGKKKHQDHHDSHHDGDHHDGGHHNHNKHGKGDNSGDYKHDGGYKKKNKYHGQSLQASVSSIVDEADIFSYEYGSTMTGAAAPIPSDEKIGANAASKSSSAAAASKTGTTSGGSTTVLRGVETLILSFIVSFLLR